MMSCTHFRYCNRFKVFFSREGGRVEKGGRERGGIRVIQTCCTKDGDNTVLRRSLKCMGDSLSPLRLR